MNPSDLLLLVVTVLAAGPVGGVGDANADRASAGGTDAEREFRDAVAAYDVHDYQRAAELFRASYDAARIPAVLFDLAQAYSALGDCRTARETFEAFIRAAPAGDPLLPRARARQSELRSCAPDPPTAAPPPPPKVVHLAVLQPGPVERGPTAPPNSLLFHSDGATPMRFTGTRWGTTCVATTGAAVALAGVGLVLGGAAWAKARSVEGAVEWNAWEQREDAEGRTLGTAATATFIASGAAAVVAGAACWLGWRRRPR